MALDTLGWAALLGGEPERAKSQFAENLTLSKQLGNKVTLSMSLEGLACVAGAEGEALRAARLFGAAEALLRSLDATLDPSGALGYDGELARARSRLGEDSYARAWQRGKTMTLGQAMDEVAGDDA
jgi:hypothetical protein